MATRIKKIFSAVSLPKNEETTNTDWKSIYIATFVAFLAATQSYNVWPYIKFINPEITETANGVFQGTAALFSAIASTVAGILVNKYSTTKPHLIVAEFLTIIAAFFYMGIELNVNVAVILIIIFHALRGIAGGFGSVYRTHMSMATAESERALLLFFFFNGKLHASTKEEEKEQIEKQESSKTAQESVTSETSPEIVEVQKYDKAAVIVLIITRVIQNINALVILSIAVPYSMAIFEWSSKDLILFQSILMAIMGLFSVAFSFVYIRYNLVKRIPERFAIICGLGIFFLFYFMTFPWWFLSSTIPYAHAIGAPAYFSRTLFTLS
uniref:Uncharacterized protein n=1 Tax=Panagrolaimus davidi TaxID=227884 RepID=A0A914PDL7_9BILA